MNNIDKPGVTSFESLGIAKPQNGPEKPRLGQEDFMKLMTTQLNNQDPFQPMENGEFLTQMAQFSAVSGLKDINDNFKILTDAMASNQALQASTLVGRQVLVPGDTNTLPQQGKMKGAVELPVSTSNLSIKIMDAKGELIHSIDMGSQKQGLVNYQWDGMKTIVDENGEKSQQRVATGQYKLVAEMVIDGKSQATTALIVDKVDSVSLGKQGQGITLNLANSGSSKLADIKQLM